LYHPRKEGGTGVMQLEAHGVEITKLNIKEIRELKIVLFLAQISVQLKNSCSKIQNECDSPQIPNNSCLVPQKH
jgi:hypothetical protein